VKGRNVIRKTERKPNGRNKKRKEKEGKEVFQASAVGFGGLNQKQLRQGGISKKKPLYAV
jgi:hypothetical protein